VNIGSFEWNDLKDSKYNPYKFINPYMFWYYVGIQFFPFQR
jgi:hypothetical protein